MFKNNFNRSNYLCKYDLINKYLLTNIYSLPKIESINLNISLTSLLIDQQDYNQLHLKIKTFIVFFLYTFNIPFLKYKNFIKYNKVNFTSNVNDFKISVNFSKKRIIHNFLISLLVENIDNLKLIDNLVVIKNIFTDDYNNLKTRIEIPLTNLHNLFYLTNSNFFSITSKEISVFMDIVLKNKKLGNKEYLLKNLLFFWII